MFCLLSIRSYEARIIMYARALYHSFKVKWIGKVYFLYTVVSKFDLLLCLMYYENRRFYSIIINVFAG